MALRTFAGRLAARRSGGLALAATLALAAAACTTSQQTQTAPPGASDEVVIGVGDGGQPITLVLMPVDGGRLTSGFGYRKNPMGGGGTKRHLGTDYGAPMRAPIRAASGGILASVGPRGSYGNYVLIRHTHVYASGYAHLSSFAKGLAAGQRVSKGQVIGYVGSTGRSTGPHLHFEVYDEGERIDPYELTAVRDTAESFDVKDSASAEVTRRPDSAEALAVKSASIFDRAGATFAAATETLGATLAAATEQLTAAGKEIADSDTGKQISAWGLQAGDEIAHSDAGRQLSEWGRQAQIAFENNVLSQAELEQLFDGFGEEDPDVIHD